MLASHSLDLSNRGLFSETEILFKFSDLMIGKRTFGDPFEGGALNQEDSVRLNQAWRLAQAY